METELETGEVEEVEIVHNYKKHKTPSFGSPEILTTTSTSAPSEKKVSFSGNLNIAS